jgi:hypothetical protein
MSEVMAMVLQGTKLSESTAYSVMANGARKAVYDEALFVSPFVTTQGVHMLNSITEDAEVKKVHWIVGLDGVITTPEALKAIAESPLTKTLTGWIQSFKKPSLHAKIYMLIRRSPLAIFMYVGSANATGDGLSENIEAGIFWACGGKKALSLRQEVNSWVEEIRSSSNCNLLDPAQRLSYAKRYKKPKRFAKRIAHVVGVGNLESGTQVEAHGDYTWIEVAVRGGSSNQIEICKDMASFFTNGRITDRHDFELIEKSTGKIYSNNSYRFRIGNFGHRIEVNTDLARSINFQAASQRHDIVLFRKTKSPTQFILEVYPAKARNTEKLISKGEQQNRVKRTIPGPGGRKYYI